MNNVWLAHHGILGQKWGIRRYQNKDGSYTSEGKKRYSRSLTLALDPAAFVIDIYSKNKKRPITDLPIIPGKLYVSSILFMPINAIQNANNESNKLSNEIYSKAKKQEPEITKDVSEAFTKHGASAYGLEHKLKTKESIKRKIETDAQEKDISIADAAGSIKDAVRYTAMSNDNNFVKAYNGIKKSLEEKGYVETRCRNYFDEYRKGNAKHKSVQSVFKSPSGYSFELQFQTPSSQDAKNKKVPIYEERRKPNVPLARQKELERMMEELAEGVSTPKDIYSIKSHG